MFTNLAEGAEGAEGDGALSHSDAAQLAQSPYIEEVPALEGAGVEVDEEIGASGQRDQSLIRRRAGQCLQRLFQALRSYDFEGREGAPHERRAASLTASTIF